MHEDQETKRISVNVPKWMHKAAKKKAAEEERPLSDVLQEMIEAWLKQHPEEGERG